MWSGRDLNPVGFLAVHRSIQTFRKNWTHLLKFAKIIQDKKLEEVIEKAATSNSPLRWIQEKLEQCYHIGSPPFGFKKDNMGELIEIPEEKEVVVRLFEDADNLKSIGQLSRETGLSKGKVGYILRNQVYKGMVRWMGQVRRGRHSPMVDPERFDRLQQKLKGSRKFGFRSLPSEYYYDLEGGFCLNYEKAARIKPMWELRIKRMNRVDIARELRISMEEVRTKLKNPFYAAKRKVNGKWEDMHHEPVVSKPRTR